MKKNKANKEFIIEELKKGKPPVVVGFEIGFLACMESINDKGYNSLFNLLEAELSQIKLKNER